jgi:hypothetical protein
MGFDVLKLMAKAPLAAELSLSPFVLFGTELSAPPTQHPADMDVVPGTVSKPFPTGRVPSVFHSLFSTRPVVSQTPTFPNFTTRMEASFPTPITAIRPGASFEKGAIRFVSTKTPARHLMLTDAIKAHDTQPRMASTAPNGTAHVSRSPVKASESVSAIVAPILASALTALSESSPSNATLPDQTTPTPAVMHEVFSLSPNAQAGIASNPAEFPHDWHVLNVLNMPTEALFLNSAQLTELISLAQASGSAETLQSLADSVFYPAAALQELALRLESAIAQASFAPATALAIQNKLVVLRANLALLKGGASLPARDAAALFSFETIPFASETETSVFQALLKEAGTYVNAMIREPARIRMEIRQSFVDLRAASHVRESFEYGGGDFQDGIPRVAASSQTSGDSQGDGESGQEQPE